MAKYTLTFCKLVKSDHNLKCLIFSEKSHHNNKNFLSRSSPDPPIFKKIAVRSSSDPANIGFSPDLWSSLPYWP